MNFLLQHIHDIVNTYKGEIPLSVFLKDYLKSYPKLGSRDRKAINQALFLYYRYVTRLPDTLSPFEVIFNGLQGAEGKNSFLETTLLRHDESLAQKLTPLLPSNEENKTWKLSEGIDTDEWLDSLLTQPDLFIRVRKSAAVNQLEKSEISFTKIESMGERCLAIPNGTKLDQILPEESYVVQDWSSQKSVQILTDFLEGNPPKTMWDTCAGAGGKSLMLKDYLPGIKILATDIRQNILQNLTERFERYQMEAPGILVTNVSDAGKTKKQIGLRRFDLVLCDVPCTGSGTWARTPEQHFFFKSKSLRNMAERQLKIASNAARYLNKGGLLAYITCSVFEEENEQIVNKLVEEEGLKLVFSSAINGIHLKADSMYVAFLQKDSQKESLPS